MILTPRPRLTRSCATYREHPQVTCTPPLASLSLTMTEDFFNLQVIVHLLVVVVVQAVVQEAAAVVEVEESLFQLQLESR